MRITGVEKRNESREKKEKKEKEEEDNSVHQNFMMNSMLQIGYQQSTFNPPTLNDNLNKSPNSFTFKF